jgi:hypothetical protein
MRYQAFGARIDSQIPLSLPLAADNPEGPDDVTSWSLLWPPIKITLGPVAMLDAGTDGFYKVGSIQYFIQGERTTIYVPRVGTIEILGDSFLRVQPVEGTSLSLLAAYITGFALLFILKKRGLITFHGSAVSNGRYAFMILGEKGGGKSTTAAALSLEGFKIYADDLALVSPQGEVFPGNPIARLMPDARESLFGVDESRGDVFDGPEKKEVQLMAENAPRRLNSIFILKPKGADRLKVTAIRGAAKAAEVFPHFSALPGIDAPATLIALAEACIKNVSVYILERPAAGDSLKEVVAAIQRVASATER